MKTKRRKIYNKKSYNKKTFRKKKIRKKTFNKKTFKKKFRNLKGGMFGWTRPNRYTDPNIEKSPDPNIEESPDPPTQYSHMTKAQVHARIKELLNDLPDDKAKVHGIGRTWFPRS